MGRVTAVQGSLDVREPERRTSRSENGDSEIYGVEELSRLLRERVRTFFHHLCVRGEVSTVVESGRGHCYFSLKEGNYLIEVAFFRGWRESKFKAPEKGQEICVTGSLDIYAPRSKYQILGRKWEGVGAGAKFAALEDLKKRLAAEGLFAEERKRILPPYPESLGIITSPDGAVLHDMLHRIRERFPLRVGFYPVRVQGKDVWRETVKGLAYFDRHPVDIVIVARGGGSVEDLWNYNEEELARAIARATCPVVSAVGHETDWTLIDWVADKRAPTPSAAIEMVLPSRRDVWHTLQRDRDVMRAHLDTVIGHAKRDVELADQRLVNFAMHVLEFARLLEESSQELRRGFYRATYGWKEELGGMLATLRREMEHAFEHGQTSLALMGHELHRAIRLGLSEFSAELKLHEKMLKTLSPEGVLERGYALVLDKEGSVLSSARSVKEESEVRIKMHDGSVTARPEEENYPK